jgi:hypothetical protein
VDTAGASLKIAKDVIREPLYNVHVRICSCHTLLQMHQAVISPTTTREWAMRQDNCTRTVSVPLRVASASKRYTAASLLFHPYSPTCVASTRAREIHSNTRVVVTTSLSELTPAKALTTSAAAWRGVEISEICNSPLTYSRGVSSNASTSRVRSGRFGTTTPAIRPWIVSRVSKMSR